MKAILAWNVCDIHVYFIMQDEKLIRRLQRHFGKEQRLVDQTPLIHKGITKLIDNKVKSDNIAPTKCIYLAVKCVL